MQMVFLKQQSSRTVDYVDKEESIDWTTTPPERSLFTTENKQLQQPRQLC
jgi:hypothetical protein